MGRYRFLYRVYVHINDAHMHPVVPYYYEKFRGSFAHGNIVTAGAMPRVPTCVDRARPHVTGLEVTKPLLAVTSNPANNDTRN